MTTIYKHITQNQPSAENQKKDVHRYLFVTTLASACLTLSLSITVLIILLLKTIS